MQPHDRDDVSTLGGHESRDSSFAIGIDADDALLGGILAGWLHSRTAAPGGTACRYRTVIAIDGKRCTVPATTTRQVHVLSTPDTHPHLTISLPAG